MSNKSLFVGMPYRKKYIFKNLSWMLFQIKTFFQRGKNGYSDYDLVDFNDYLTHILAYGLREYGMNTNKIPYKFLEMFDNENDAWDYWRNYVLEMSQHFYNSMEENKDEVMPNKYRKYFVMCPMRCKSRHPVMQKYWEEERRIDAWQDEEKKKALEMLTKVFDDLWD